MIDIQQSNYLTMVDKVHLVTHKCTFSALDLFISPWLLEVT
jgi:hypothetical protein